jgi:hypothetical protein
MVSSTPIDILQNALTQQGYTCETDPKNHKLHVQDPANIHHYDIKVFAQYDASNRYPDGITLCWDTQSQNWLFTHTQLSRAQQKFLHGTTAFDDQDTFTLCSLFWALHLGVKHVACESPLVTVHSLIQKIILQPKRSPAPKNQAILDILHKFADTPYWHATLTNLLEVPFYFPNAHTLPQVPCEPQPLIRLLLPNDATLPPGMDWILAEDQDTLDHPHALLQAIKKSWQRHETHPDLLHTQVGAIDWGSVALNETTMACKK